MSKIHNRFLAFIWCLLVSVGLYGDAKNDVTESRKRMKGKVTNKLNEALKMSKKKNKAVFLILYDGRGKDLSKIDYYTRWFFSTETVQDKIAETFIQAIIPVQQKGASKYKPEDVPLDHCRIVIIAPGDKVLFNENMVTNPTAVSKLATSLVKLWRDHEGKAK